MIYPKPKDMKYTDMSIYFDKNFWSDDTNEELCYKYLYLIFDMLAHIRNMFHLHKDYENFCLYCATTLYMRFLKRKRNGKEKIKSVLNYAKSIIGHLKDSYLEQEYASSVIRCNDEDSKIDITQMQEYLREPVRGQYSKQIDNAIQDAFKELPEIIRQTVKNTPYKKDKIVLRNIEISCILTLFKSFKLNTKAQEKLSKNQRLDRLGALFSEERKTSLTLFRLDDSMTDTISFLCNKIRKIISEEIMCVIQENTIPNEVVDSILTTAWDSTNHIQGNESSNLTYEGND